MSHAPIDIGSAGVSTVAGERNMASIVIISIIATLGGFLFGFFLFPLFDRPLPVDETAED